LLAAGLAHDLNNMLGAIIATTELVSARLDPASESARDLAAVTDQAARAGALIRQILAFSRQEVLQPVSTSFADILSALGPTLAALVGSRANLEIGIAAATPLLVDRIAMERVLVNLLLNARDALQSQQRRGRGHIRIEAGQSREAASFMPAGDYGWLSVSDDGPGVDPMHAARIFEPYFTTRPNGQGLGLATAFGLVKQSRGFLLLDRGALGGARFTIYIPQTISVADRAPAARTGVQTPLILLAEDEALLRLSTARALESVGFRVLASESGEQALGIFDTTPGISALVSDIRMGGISGVELAELLRRRDPDLPVLLISGYADEAARHGVSGLDVAFLAKPFGLKDLTARIDAIL